MMTNPQSTASNPTIERTVRLTRPSVVVLYGPAACGKSTFAARYFRLTQIVSSDRARALVCDDERDQRFSAEAFALVNFIVDQRLRINRLSVVDSTALTPEVRKSLLDLARRHGAPCVVFLFDVPLETCIERDRGRERSVGQAVIERQYRLFAQHCSNMEREGFDQVIKLDDDDLDKLRIDVLFRPVPKPSGPGERGGPRRAAFQARNERREGVRRGPAPAAPPQSAPRPSPQTPQSAGSSAPLRPDVPPASETQLSPADAPAPNPELPQDSHGASPKAS
jgi:protein phosphatase